MGKVNSKQRREKAKKVMKELGISNRGKYIKLICSLCGRVFKIRITNRSSYTDDIIKKWKCAFCSTKS